MAGRPYVLAETTWKTVQATEYEVALLPWGATEADNYHLPYGTDNYQCEHVATEAARLAWEAGARVVVLPTVPFGVQTGQLDIPFCLNLNPSSQAVVLGDIARSLATQGVRKLIVINGHGGNDFRQMIRELQPQVPVLLMTVSLRAVDAGEHFEDPGDHGGELETSLMLHIAPELVLPLKEAGDGRERRPRIEALREGWAWAPRPWTKVSRDTGVGNPRAASAKKGATFAAALAERVASFLIELAAADPEELYEEDQEASAR